MAKSYRRRGIVNKSIAFHPSKSSNQKCDLSMDIYIDGKKVSNINEELTPDEKKAIIETIIDDQSD